jgi:predicted nucleotidyltransferase
MRFTTAVNACGRVQPERMTGGAIAVKWRAALDAIVAELERAPSVDSAFLSGSLVDGQADDYADVDLGVASRDGTEAFGEAFDLRHRLLAAATRQGERVFGAKRAHRCLSAAERAVLEASYLCSDEDVVARLARLYLGVVTGLEPAYRIANEVEALRAALCEIVDG